MSWITPKIDWTADDYYNLEDAQRIAGNICYLKDMAVEIYGSNHYDILVKRVGKYLNGKWVAWYGLVSNVSVPSINTTPPSYYRHTTVDFLYDDYTNFLALMYLNGISVSPEVKYVENYSIYYNIDTSQPPITTNFTYTGNCIVDDRVGYTAPPTATTPLQCMLGTTTKEGTVVNPENMSPLSTSWRNKLGTATIRTIQDFDKMRNTPFWNHITLNYLENKIRVLEITFSKYLRG